MKAIKFIHAADLHIDSPFIGLKHLPEQLFERMIESTFYAFSNLIQLAIEEQVDFLLLAGDLFDGEDRSLKAQLRIKQEFERLNQHNIPVFLTHGNHDHFGGTWMDLSWPENVHVFSHKQVEQVVYVHPVHGSKVNLYGYSYPSRAVYENVTEQFPKAEGADFHIGLLHGSVDGNSNHAPYCPFRTAELLNKGFDYWALGHIHKRQILNSYNPPILYSGNLQGRHTKETGEKGCFLVTLSKEETTYIFQPLQDVIWIDYKVSIDEKMSFNQLFSSLQEELNRIQTKYERAVVMINLAGKSEMYHDLQKEETVQDLIEVLNERQLNGNRFVWIARLINNLRPLTEKASVFSNSSFIKDLQATITRYDGYPEALSPLIKHPVYRKHFGIDSQEDYEKWLNEAEELLFSELQKEGNRR
ncbi:metallophosphoesterase family protein [Metabacillus arenae]|uniref:DNA repair exonuclease n=1 Tax=Metabacillus arenae TaxID=2771434 RepID=A0A926RYV6_9BACI|nr:DNA repair exonuclease [Metabacillus arenae]MBD1383373.1 DNA repair exonuclease [Metabacillus arenae]